ncbi:Fe-S-containing hydro-lyase [Thermovibrio ammonificans]|jgi:fumarate hydratase subunit beta|uniref:Hydro-lyase, Fe-S type, tartrate/fumarate subfamily, beta subunit n=1 Tax=Thermovibrio ammonificans (strain DSM 15698 / JCM 12110 / HB-1) TaxID=648996 RepID=E8T6B3_THEA1|nr:Fe-S-containing hydro-lyase [Thermovibrio ammonificans]ADU96697.1 hydro-lyase, Fe-S type, tartrate/fumarate subfamily, beta subunit [Thermovibrio ammonificans HB-1]
MSAIKIETPISDSTIEKLKAGDFVLISGVIYTARDAAHKRMVEALERGEPLPFDLEGQVIYYAGPAPAKPGRPIGSVGPTTSYRMDPYAPKLLEAGLKGMIGKGSRSKEVIEAIKKYKGVYFGAVGGAAAYLARCVKSAEVIAYEDLGPEAVRRLVVEDFPAFVVNDIYGNDLYTMGRCEYELIEDPELKKC